MLPAGGISFRSESLLALFTFSAVALYAKARSGGKAVYLAPHFLYDRRYLFFKGDGVFLLSVTVTFMGDGPVASWRAAIKREKRGD
jgi:hypothetical protein